MTTPAELGDTMAMTLGGRAAEEIVFGEVTTGAVAARARGRSDDPRSCGDRQAHHFDGPGPIAKVASRLIRSHTSSEQ